MYVQTLYRNAVRVTIVVVKSNEYYRSCVCICGLLLLLSVGLPVANDPDVLQPCTTLRCSNSHHQSSPKEIPAVRGGAKRYNFHH
jgi:hypothetical protein